MEDEDEKKKKLENGTIKLTSFIDNGVIQRGNSTVQEAAQYPPFHFGSVKNGMFLNTLTGTNITINKQRFKLNSNLEACQFINVMLVEWSSDLAEQLFLSL